MGERTSATKAHSKSKSLRSTIPDGVVQTLQLKEKDVLDWKETTHEGKPAYVITKVEK